MIEIRLVAPPARPTADAVAVLVGPDPDAARRAGGLGGAALDAGLRAELAAFLADVDGAGAAGRVEVLPRPGRRPGRVYTVGVGDGGPAALRRAAAMLVRAAGRHRRVLALLPADLDPDGLRAAVEGAGLGSYRYRLSPSAGRPALARLDLAVPDPDRPGYAAALGRGSATAAAVHLARDLVNTPPSEKTPGWLAAQAQRRLAPLGVRVSIRDIDWLTRNRFGGVLAVGGGSARGPRLITAEWRPAAAARRIVLVGKGITFDTGGLSIKPTEAMLSMKTDMAGGAAVLAAVHAAAALALPVRVTAVVPAAENAVSGSAYRPADVIRHPNGRTTEVLNTDAEGRLVLADALSWAASRLSPDALVDVATLTGAAKVALGTRTGALFATDDGLADALSAAAAAAGEKLWRLPLVEDYTERLHSEVADAVNAAGGGAGSITAALFLRPFTGAAPWAHLDIAGPARAGADDAEISAGGTGFGVRTLLRWLEDGAGGR